MKRKLTALLLTSAMLATLTACGKDESKTESNISSPETSQETTTENTIENTIADTTPTTTEKETDTVSITKHPEDDKYFVPYTEDWFLYSENGCFTDVEELEKDCTESQTLYSFKTDGSLAAQIYKVVYKTAEAAQSALEYMPNYPFTPEAQDYVAVDNVLYIVTGVLTYDKKARFIERMEDDSLVKDLGNGIYGYVMGGGAVWAKYQFSMLDSETGENGENIENEENGGSTSLGGTEAGDISKGAETQSENNENQSQTSPWIGVWESSNGDVFVGKNGCDFFYFDSSNGRGWQINVMDEEINGNYIESRMIDPQYDYNALYQITIDGNTLTYTETFNDEPTEYTNVLFTKTERTDVEAAWDEYWNMS